MNRTNILINDSGTDLSAEGYAALFWWCCYRVWTAEDKD